VTVKQAQALASADTTHGFPIVVSPGMVTEVNRWVGTPLARRSLREILGRLAKCRDRLEAILQHHRLPLELLAIPLVESAYQADARAPETDGKARGVGLWMIVSRTARRYGLRIGQTVDERLNEEKSTEAAARYLSHLYRLFHDWPLALVAYNRGETFVKERIAENGSRNAWTVQDETSRYLDRAMAAAFLLRHPSLYE
jgi:membrane-bound lytic murein transglycosylase D